MSPAIEMVIAGVAGIILGAAGAWVVDGILYSQNGEVPWEREGWL